MDVRTIIAARHARYLADGAPPEYVLLRDDQANALKRILGYSAGTEWHPSHVHDMCVVIKGTELHKLLEEQGVSTLDMTFM